MKTIIVIVLISLSACSSIPETRDCLVSYNGNCLQYDFSSSRGLNPMGNARELIQVK
jgi:hypothetical protein